MEDNRNNGQIKVIYGAKKDILQKFLPNNEIKSSTKIIIRSQFQAYEVRNNEEVLYLTHITKSIQIHIRKSLPDEQIYKLRNENDNKNS